MAPSFNFGANCLVSHISFEPKQINGEFYPKMDRATHSLTHGNPPVVSFKRIRGKKFYVSTASGFTDCPEAASFQQTSPLRALRVIFHKFGDCYQIYCPRKPPEPNFGPDRLKKKPILPLVFENRHIWLIFAKITITFWIRMKKRLGDGSWSNSYEIVRLWRRGLYHRIFAIFKLWGPQFCTEPHNFKIFWNFNFLWLELNKLKNMRLCAKNFPDQGKI